MCNWLDWKYISVKQGKGISCLLQMQLGIRPQNSLEKNERPADSRITHKTVLAQVSGARQFSLNIEKIVHTDHSLERISGPITANILPLITQLDLMRFENLD